MMLFSVIIPNFNGSRFIAPLFESLSGLTDPGVDYEFLFVDNGSTDDSLSQLELYGARLHNFRLLSYTEKQSSYAARNYAARNTASPYLVFTDVDCRPKSDWLTRIFAHRELLEAGGLLSGDVHLRPEGDELNLYGLCDKVFSLNQANYAKTMHGATANLVVPRVIWKIVQGFPEVESGGDIVFCERVIRNGAEFRFDPDLIVEHPARERFEELKAKSMRLGRGTAEIALRTGSKGLYWKAMSRALIGLVFPLHQFRRVYAFWKQKKPRLSVAVPLLVLSIRMGCIQRWATVKALTPTRADK